MGKLENLLLSSQIAERADVSNDQRHAKLIFRADLTQRQAPVFQGDSAARSVVADLHELILNILLFDIVTDTEEGVPAAAVQVPISNLGANLVRDGLQNRIVVDGKMRNGEVEILHRM